jgi:hypothetical protein
MASLHNSPRTVSLEQRFFYTCFYRVITMHYTTREEILKLGEIDPELAAVSSSKTTLDKYF